MNSQKNRLISEILKNELDPSFKRRAGFILEEVSAGRDGRILDLGCGRGFYVRAISRLYPQAEIYGADNNAGYIRAAKAGAGAGRIKFLQADALNLPFKNGFFDLVICSEMLEHVDRDRQAMAEIYRVVKKGGKAIITVPHKNYPLAWDPVNWILEKVTGRHIPANIWWLAGIWADHVRLYREEEIKEKMESGGWKILSLKRLTRYSLPGAHFLLYGIGKNLVELGVAPGFDRFNFVKKERPSFLLRAAMKVIYFFDRRNEGLEIGPGGSFLHLALTAEKV